MLLQNDISDLLVLLENPESLTNNVNQALKAINNLNKKDSNQNNDLN